jgi:hypothetical protein
MSFMSASHPMIDIINPAHQENPLAPGQSGGVILETWESKKFEVPVSRPGV